MQQSRWDEWERGEGWRQSVEAEVKRGEADVSWAVVAGVVVEAGFGPVWSGASHWGSQWRASLEKESPRQL